jgi:hypothetical protein
MRLAHLEQDAYKIISKEERTAQRVKTIKNRVVTLFGVNANGDYTLKPADIAVLRVLRH